MSEFELKRITNKGVPEAIEKAKHYRLLNEPWEAESICRDVLAIDKANQEALITLILALTDQFEQQTSTPQQAKELLSQLTENFELDYYDGIINERAAKAKWRHNDPIHTVIEGITQAMVCYRRAEPNAPAGNDNVLLRWNTCVRMLEHLNRVKPEPVDYAVPFDTGDSPL